MSPFDLPGPMFLMFYFFCGAVGLIGLTMAQELAERRDARRVNLSDPYLIAFLRGGKNEALRIASVSLIDRGLLKVSGSMISPGVVDAAKQVRSPLEGRLLRFYDRPKEASSVFSDHSFDGLMSNYEQELVGLGLMPDASIKSSRWKRLSILLMILWGVAIIKLGVAYSTGHKNIQLLIILAALVGFLGYRIAHPHQTGRGKALLADLKTLFSSLKGRASSFMPGSNPNELALLAAVFGVSMLPKTLFPYAETLYPKAESSGGSSGSSCGSSCGGGGCGGGCGGCGS